MKNIKIDGIPIEYIQKRSKRKSITASVNNDGVLCVRTPHWVSDLIVRQFLLENAEKIIKMTDRARARIEYEKKLEDGKLGEMMKKAEEIIPGRVEYYSGIMGVAPSRVRINFAKTRFGSCSSKGSVNFSCRLMAYSANAVDYVVVHELAHLIHMNHSGEFWKTVEKYIPDYRLCREELKGIPKV